MAMLKQEGRAGEEDETRVATMSTSSVAVAPMAAAWPEPHLGSNDGVDRLGRRWVRGAAARATITVAAAWCSCCSPARFGREIEGESERRERGSKRRRLARLLLYARQGQLNAGEGPPRVAATVNATS